MKCDHRRLFSSLPFDLLISPPIFLLRTLLRSYLRSLLRSFHGHGRGVVSAPCHEKLFAKTHNTTKGGNALESSVDAFGRAETGEGAVRLSP